MKIIATDNFNRESVSDRLVAESVSEFDGPIMVEALNRALGGEYAQKYYQLVPDDHKLYTFEP